MLLKKKKLPNIVSGIISSVLLAFGIISIFLHICIITIIAIILATIIFGLSLCLFLKGGTIKPQLKDLQKAETKIEKQTEITESIMADNKPSVDNQAKAQNNKSKKKKKKSKWKKGKKNKHNKKK